MRRRFGRNRRGSRTGDARNAVIDAARWFERLTGEGIVPVPALEPIEAADVPPNFAVLGIGETEAGERVLVGFAPRHAGNAALATLAQAQRLAGEEGFEGEALAVAPQWSIAARRRLSLLGSVSYRFRALAASSLGEEAGAVEREPAAPPPPLGPARLGAALAEAGDRDLFARALSALEGLAAKHGGAVRSGPDGAELVLLARRSAVLRPGPGGIVLETLLPERASATLGHAGLAAEMDRLEGQLRRRLNDRRVKGSDEQLRALALTGLAQAAELRATAMWPLAGSDPEVIDLVGLDAEGRPVVGIVRSRVGLADLAAILDAALELRPALPLLFGEAPAPLRLGELRLALAARAVDDAVLRALAALTLDHGVYELRPRRGAAPEIVLRDAARGAPSLAPREGRRRRQRGPRGKAAGAPPSADGAAADEAPAREAPVVEDISLFDVDDDARRDAEGDEETPRGRRRRRGRRRGRRPAEAGEETAAPAEDAEALEASDELEDVDETQELLAEDLDHDPAATLAPLEDEVPDVADVEETQPAYDEEEEAREEEAEELDDAAAWSREREERRRARLSKLVPEPEPEGAPRAPRRRAAIVAHADRDSVLAAVLLARDLRLVEGFWVYPQSELMTFFRSVATDLRAETPIHVVGFTARPARDTIHAATLYAGRLFWYDHHDWPPEDLDSLRAAIGADCVKVEPGSGSSLPAVLEDRLRRSRFSDKLVELATGRFSQHDFERWGRLWWTRLEEIAGQSGERRSAINPLLSGRPSDLAKEAAQVPPPPAPAELAFVSEHDFRVVHSGGLTIVVLAVPEALDIHLSARMARERFGAEVSLAWRQGEELVVLSADEKRGRNGLDLDTLVSHLAAKHDWIDALRDEDHVVRMRVHGLASRPERLDEVVGEVGMGRSLLEG